MFDKEAVITHQKFISDQEEKKPGFPEQKLWEEMEELKMELIESLDSGKITENMIAELGDFLFCVLGNPELAYGLQKRLDFDVERALKRMTA